MGKQLKESKMTKLNETFFGKGQIIESDSSKLPTGVLCRVRYPICLIDKKNRNERIYRKSVWENVLKNVDVKEKLERRVLFGNQEHPIESALKLNKDDTSHIVSSIILDEAKNMVFADFDVLPTEAGRFINVLLEAGCDVGTSTRAEGELEEKIEEKSGDKYYEVVPESYQFITVDFTADPSTIGAYPVEIQRNVVDHVKNSFESNRINKGVAVALLEGIKTKEAIKLMESIQKIKEEDMKVKEEPKPGEKVEKLGKDEKDSKEGKPIDGETPNAKQGGKDLEVDKKGEQKKDIQVGDPADHVDNLQNAEGEDEDPEKKKAKELKGAEEPEHVAKEILKKTKESKLVFENWDDMVDYMKAEFKKIKPDQQKKVRRGLSECMSASDIQKRVSELKNESVVASAKLDRLVELYDQLKESYIQDAVDHTALVEKLKKDNVEFTDKAVVETKKLMEMNHLEVLTELTVQYKKELDEATNKFELQLKELKEASEKKLSESIEVKTKEIASLKEAHTKGLIKKYFETKVAVTGLSEHLTKNALTLLEHCVSEEDVDKAIDNLRENIRLGVMSPTISEVKETKAVPQAQMILNTKVGNILGKINP